MRFPFVWLELLPCFYGWFIDETLCYLLCGTSTKFNFRRSIHKDKYLVSRRPFTYESRIMMKLIPVEIENMALIQSVFYKLVFTTIYWWASIHKTIRRLIVCWDIWYCQDHILLPLDWIPKRRLINTKTIGHFFWILRFDILRLGALCCNE